MSEAEMMTCSRCGRAIDIDTRCEICGQQLCHYDIRVLDGHVLCPRCYKEETFQYHSKECDIPG
jgi:recombinational DNA repair protein (RecF pathway)